MNNKTIYNSALFSLITQFIIGIICTIGLFIPIKPKDQVLNSILVMETIVQFIEFVFYYWLVKNINNINYDVTYIRYFDWVITTPTMLLSLIIFMIYINSNEIITFTGVIQDNSNKIFQILSLNAFMLLFGFLGEIKYLSKTLSFLFGSIFFVMSFALIYFNYVKNSTLNNYIFYINFIIWALYGISFLLSYTNKNIMYNILDIFSKNLNGLFFLFYILYINYY
ncbi:hypothetical protein CL656_00060 [bacterium]|nr:hypothetical protein [bacterium]|tara:strand:- start:6740 stop:7411 length:672 start_codon:yes stop_codon:yes gene_type:complete